MGQPAILIADGDERVRDNLSGRLRKEGYTVYSCRDGNKAWRTIKTRQPCLVIAELELSCINGMLLLEQIRHLMPQIPVILTTTHGSIRNAVWAMKMGATDFLTKPMNPGEVAKLVRSSTQEPTLDRQHEHHSPKGHETAVPELMVGSSPPMQAVYNLVDRVACTGSNILITGETGTGKELVAQEIHSTGSKAKAPLVTIDCAAIPENLLESELFGYSRGAFTGADRSKAGQIEQAHGGTLFMDEIGEMPLSLQKKVLRFLQEKAFTRVGGTKLRQVDLRIIAATNKNLKREVEQGRFRKDLYYRLDVIRINVPPLRDRKQDIPTLVDAFVAKFAPRCNPAVRGVSQQVMDILAANDWPGNVRELENVMERAVVLAEGDTVTQSCLPDHVTGRDRANPGSSAWSLPAMERSLLQQVLKRNRGNQSATARELGISRKQLRTKMARHDLLGNSFA